MLHAKVQTLTRYIANLSSRCVENVFSFIREEIFAR